MCVFKVLLKSISKHLNSFFLILENIFSRDLGDCVFDGRREGRQHFWGKILSVAFHELLRESCIESEAITYIFPLSGLKKRQSDSCEPLPCAEGSGKAHPAVTILCVYK